MHLHSDALTALAVTDNRRNKKGIQRLYIIRKSVSYDLILEITGIRWIKITIGIYMFVEIVMIAPFPYAGK